MADKSNQADARDIPLPENCDAARGRGFQIFWSFKKEKFVEFCYKKTYQNELQNQDSCSLQFKKSKVGTRAQGIQPLIDKVKDGCGVTKFKKLSKEQWLYDGDESIELFAAPQHFPFEVGEMSDLRTNPFKGGGVDAILIEPVEAYEWMQPRGCDFVDEPEWMKTLGCDSVNEPEWMKTHGCDSVDEPNVQKEDPFAIYVGPITRLRSKKLSEKVVGLIQNLESEEELLDGCGVTKFKKLSKEQWLYDGDESIELFAAPQHFPFEVGEMSDLRTNPFKGGGVDAILIEPVEAYEWMQPRGCDFVDEPEWMKTLGCDSVNEPEWMKTHGCDSVDEPNVQKEDPFAIYVGPITRLRSKKLSEKVVGLIQNLESEEELLGITSTFSTTSTTT
ncbi:hypothetical protein DY000_02021929 [Brassica cretica]|uniref:Uncharacterized protein n=1 Tax=Brassica cretica TaxID=69181 RepID=A0ABQ7ELE6_BRACR|nr:hypothetical protein DY000_02021929 [Brassica cretica]